MSQLQNSGRSNTFSLAGRSAFLFIFGPSISQMSTGNLLLSLWIQISPNTPRITFDQISGHPVARWSSHIKWITTPLRKRKKSQFSLSSNGGWCLIQDQWAPRTDGIWRVARKKLEREEKFKNKPQDFHLDWMCDPAIPWLGKMRKGAFCLVFFVCLFCGRLVGKKVQFWVCLFWGGGGWMCRWS